MQIIQNLNKLLFFAGSHVYLLLYKKVPIVVNEL